MKPSWVTVISIYYFYPFVLCCPSSPEDCNNEQKLNELTRKLGVQDLEDTRSELDQIEKSINGFQHPAQCKGWVKQTFLGVYQNKISIVVNYINKRTVEQISMYYYGEGVNIMIYCESTHGLLQLWLPKKFKIQKLYFKIRDHSSITSACFWLF